MWGFVKKIGRAIVHGVSGGLSWLINVGFWGIQRLLGIPELILSLFGWRVRKKLRLKVIILLDPNNKPLVTEAQVDYVIAEAKTAFKQRANVRILANKGTSMVETYSGTNPEWVLSVKCDGGAFKQSFRRVGRWFRAHAHQSGGLTMFVVRDVQGKNGCFLGSADYGLIDLDALPVSGGTLPLGRALTLAHELGHGCDLLHRKNPHNLMRRTGVTRTAHMTNWQVAVLRSSRKVRYFG